MTSASQFKHGRAGRVWTPCRQSCFCLEAAAGGGSCDRAETGGPAEPETVPLEDRRCSSDRACPGAPSARPSHALPLAPFNPLPTLRGKVFNIPIFQMKKLSLVLLLITKQELEPALNPRVLVSKPHLNPDAWKAGFRHWGPSAFHTYSPGCWVNTFNPRTLHLLLLLPGASAAEVL